MSYEQTIINYFSKKYKKIGDDCAYINTTKQLISSDTLVENKHFDFNRVLKIKDLSNLEFVLKNY